MARRRLGEQILATFFIEIQSLSKMYLKTPSANWRPFSLDLSVSTDQTILFTVIHLGICQSRSLFFEWICLVSSGIAPSAVTYRKTSSISRTKSQNLNVSCILLQLSSLNPGVKLRMKMYLEQRRRAINYIWVINNFIAYLGVTYTKGFTVGPFIHKE